jgi:hypothetical protein
MLNKNTLRWRLDTGKYGVGKGNEGIGILYPMFGLREREMKKERDWEMRVSFPKCSIPMGEVGNGPEMRRSRAWNHSDESEASAILREAKKSHRRAARNEAAATTAHGVCSCRGVP